IGDDRLPHRAEAVSGLAEEVDTGHGVKPSQKEKGKNEKEQATDEWVKAGRFAPAFLFTFAFSLLPSEIRPGRS
ncbi:MAG: hypothetical protein K2V38_19300, partial [Gemmataceae bacterium]|nr:hypothetical protein [Gemmataceae bacterium]